jgi:ABC-type ATPase involved in cell division
LPDRIDVADFALKGQGAAAARNFLAVAGIDLQLLVSSDTRSRAAILRKANQKVTNEFLAFWTQTIGKKGSLELACSIHHYSAGQEKVGQTYLEFLITDGSTPLYPKQRSRGTRWFISFFLQLQASALRGRKRVFLLDEPGANLHEKAQSDVLALVEKIRGSIPVIYSTHSPHLISYGAIHRILAVERDPDTLGHPTKVIDAHSLGAASIDTLSPILSTMGVALSRQTAIKQHHNVLLEELSGYYYLRAFWKLTGCTQEAHFLAATGASNIPQLANLFLGWGLDFIVVVDDEPSGRTVYKALKRDLFLDQEGWAKARMLKIPDCEGIEDIFEVGDYKELVLRNSDVQINGPNSKWAKNNGAAKAVHALNFLQAVEAGNVDLRSLNQATVTRIQNLVLEISGRLSSYQREPLESAAKREVR